MRVKLELGHYGLVEALERGIKWEARFVVVHPYMWMDIHHELASTLGTRIVPAPAEGLAELHVPMAGRYLVFTANPSIPLGEAEVK